ncbi:MAG: hypothetical protein RLZ12_672 [Bacillota bacterium]|jgi:lysophospholipase L1-like esterase
MLFRLKLREECLSLGEKKEKKSVLFIALGDSLTEGIGLAGVKGHWLDKCFQKLKCSTQCSWRNLGISGLTSSELLTLLSIPAFECLLARATHISITTGGCDFIEVYNEWGMDKVKFIERMEEVALRTKDIMEQIRKLNAAAKLYLLGFYIPKPAYQLDIDEVSVLVQNMNKTYCKICKRAQAVLIDPFAAFFNRFDYFHDEVHPNQDGYNCLAELALAYF